MLKFDSQQSKHARNSHSLNLYTSTNRTQILKSLNNLGTTNAISCALMDIKQATVLGLKARSNITEVSELGQ